MDATEQYAELFQLGDDLKLTRANVIALVKDMGIEKAMRALVILADGSADSMKARRMAALTRTAQKTQPAAKGGNSLIDQLLRGSK